MSKLCLGTLLTAIKKCAIEKGFVQWKVYGEMFSFLGSSQDIDPSFIGHIVRGDKNPPAELLDSINNMYPEEYPKIISCFDGVSSRIDANKTDLFGKIIKKIADGDDDINEDTVVDLVNGTKKKDLPGHIDNLSSFIAGIYIYVIKHTDNRNKIESVKEINHQFIAEIISKTMTAHIDEQDEIAAKSFLIKHEKEKELIPLCQIAYMYNPYHQHVRSMYTEYCLLPHRVRKYILEQCDAEFLIEEEMHWGKGLDYFQEDLRAYGLSSERYIYMFGQYLYRAFEYYSNRKIEEYDIYSFKRLYNPLGSPWAVSPHSDMNQYVDDYLWMNENNIKDVAMKPMDYLWREKNFGFCDDEVLTFWLCRFVIDVCYNLFFKIKNTDFPYTFPKDNYAETQEDLFYCALLSLHNHYLCHQNKEKTMLAYEDITQP